MWSALFCLAMVGAAVSFIGLIVALVTRRPKKPWLLSVVGSAVLVVVGVIGGVASQTPEERARHAAERKAEAEAEQKAEAEAKVKAEAEEKARAEAKQKAKAEAEEKATVEAEKKVEAASDNARVKVSELLNRVKHDREMLASIMKESKYSDQWLLSYYETVGSAQSKVQSEGELGDKDLEAEIAALGSEAASAYRRVRSGLSLVVKERSGKTFFGGKSKYDLILKNQENSKLFADNYQVKKVDVDVLLSEPIFGVRVERIRISFGSIEPGDTSVEEVTSDFSGLQVDRAIIYPRKAEKKGVTYDSNVFDL